LFFPWQLQCLCFYEEQSAIVNTERGLGEVMRQAFHGSSPRTDSEPAFGCAKGQGREAVTEHGTRPSWLTSGRRAERLVHTNTAIHFCKNLAIAGRLFDVMI
jgi:hypothetical protein